MTQKQNVLWIITVLLGAAIIVTAYVARGKDKLGDKPPAAEKRSLTEEMMAVSHPIGNILGARVNAPDRNLNLWNIEAVAGIGITGDANGEINREYDIQLTTSATDAARKPIGGPFAGEKRGKGNKSFISTLGVGGTISDAPASGKLTITVKLTATGDDGKVIELDEFTTTADIP